MRSWGLGTDSVFAAKAAKTAKTAKTADVLGLYLGLPTKVLLLSARPTVGAAAVHFLPPS